MDKKEKKILFLFKPFKMVETKIINISLFDALRFFQVLLNVEAVTQQRDK